MYLCPIIFMDIVLNDDVGISNAGIRRDVNVEVQNNVGVRHGEPLPNDRKLLFWN